MLFRSVQTSCEYCGASHTSLCSPHCQRPKLYFRKKRPPFCNHPERWDPVTGYEIDFAVNTAIVPQDTNHVDGDGENHEPLEQMNQSHEEPSNQHNESFDIKISVKSQTERIGNEDDPSLPNQHEENHFEDEKKEMDIVQALEYSLPPPPESTATAGVNASTSSNSNDHGTWWMTNFCLGSSKSPHDGTTSVPTTVTPPGTPTASEVASF